MTELKGTKTERNLQLAFADEAQSYLRYVYFAQRAEIEGYTEVAKIFRSTAESETGHAHGHLEFLEDAGDPLTDHLMGDTHNNLRATIAGETGDHSAMYPKMARTAREEGFDEIADWFESLAKTEKAHAARFEKALKSIE